MIDRLLRPHPNGLAIERPNGRPTISGSGWFPVLNLIWLVWVFVAPWLPGRADPQVLLLTYATVPLFLWLYLRAWYGDRRHAPRYTAAIAALALLTVPLDTTISYLIYTGALLPFVLRPRTALLALAALLLTFATVALLAGGRWMPILGWTITTAAISSINLFFAINTRRDAELRLSQQEVRRLAAAAERERIGRDLHDSAIQPYLGLKYAVEAVALRIAPDNPARREVDTLVALVNAEVGELREFISGLRSGEPKGDNALLPAVRS